MLKEIGRTPGGAGSTIGIDPCRATAGAKKSWDDFRNDAAWKSLRETSEANGALVAKVDSIFVAPTDFSPLK